MPLLLRPPPPLPNPRSKHWATGWPSLHTGESVLGAGKARACSGLLLVHCVQLGGSLASRPPAPLLDHAGHRCSAQLQAPQAVGQLAQGGLDSSLSNLQPGRPIAHCPSCSRALPLRAARLQGEQRTLTAFQRVCMWYMPLKKAVCTPARLAAQCSQPRRQWPLLGGMELGSAALLGTGFFLCRKHSQRQRRCRLASHQPTTVVATALLLRGAEPPAQRHWPAGQWTPSRLVGPLEHQPSHSL